jgi:glycosyltransferase involved in cell wall biosynthesis
MSLFLIANLYETPNLRDDNEWNIASNKIRRDFPWLLTENHGICLSGIGNHWCGRSRREQIVSHASTSASPWFTINVLLAWFTHAMDVLRLSRRETVTVIAPSPEAGLGCTLARAFAKRRVRIVVRVTARTASKSLYMRPSKLRFALIKMVERLVLRHADLVIPMGKFTYEIAKSHGVSSKKLVVLPMPVPWKTRAEITDPPARPTILTAARLVEEKGIQLILQAMPRVLQDVPKARLLIAGEGRYRKVLEQMANSLGIGDKVSFLGWLDADELRRLYRKTSLFVMPSIWEEGLGMVFVEAGLMARPVIASDRGGVLDIIRNGENGFLVPPRNAYALAIAITAVLKDRALALRMGMAGSRIALEYLEGRDKGVEDSRAAIYKLAACEVAS